MTDRHLRRKLTFKAHGGQVVLVKARHERMEHVWMKALVWALYLPFYPDLGVEISVGGRYKPDVVSTGPFAQPRFWGEAGKVSREKIEALVRRYPRTHFALAKWDAPLTPFEQMVREALREATRHAPFDLLRFPPESAERFIDARGRLALSHDDLTWTRLDATAM